MAEKLEIIIEGKDRFSKAFKGLQRLLPSFKRMALGAAAGAAGLGTALFAIANSTAKAGDEMQKMSLRLGLSTDMLSGMKHAVELSGGSIEEFEKGVRTLAKRMSDADDGLAEAKRSFESLGIEVKAADGSLKNLDIIMAEAADGLAKMEDNTKRVALAQELFGRSGTQLLPLFKQGADGIRKMNEEAKTLGITFDKTGADQAAEFRDNMLRLQRVFTGIKTQIGQAIIPIFSEWAATGAEAGKRIVKYVRENKDEIQGYAETFLAAMGQMAQIGLYTGALLVDSWRGWNMVALKGQKIWADFGIMLEKHVAPVLDKIFRKTNVQAELTIKRLEEFGEAAEANLAKLTVEPMAIQRVADIAARIKDAIAEIRAAAKDVEPTTGIPPYDDENVDRTKSNIQDVINAQQKAIDALREMHDQYFLTEADRLRLWYEEQKEIIGENQEGQLELDAVYWARLNEMEDQEHEKRISREQATSERLSQERMRHLQNLHNIGILFGKKGIAISKALAIPHAVMATHEAAVSAYKAMAGIPIIGPALAVAAAAAAIAHGMREVGIIKGIAHGGLEYVPREQTYLLGKGERVLSAPQNVELSEALRGGEMAPIEQTIIFHILENATNVEALRQMTRRDWEDLGEEKIVPALRSLKLRGITI